MRTLPPTRAAASPRTRRAPAAGASRAAAPRRGGIRLQCFGTILLGALTSCGGGGGGGGAPPPPVLPTGVQALAEAVVGPAGGSLSVDSGVYGGAVLSLGAAALAQPTDVVLGVQQADPQFPGEFPVWVLLPEATPLAGPVELTVPFGAVHRFFLDLLGLEGLVLRREADGSLTPMPTLRVDAVAGTITAQVDRFGEYVALDSTFFRLLAQRFELVDPAVPVEVVDLGGALLPVASGDGQVQVGRGSVAQFWSSGAADNVLVVHGFNSNPLEFLGAEDLLEQLAVRYENVLALQYPSACGIAENGLALYDLVRARAQAGFGCHVVAHSMGGLVVRYALEQAHLVRGGAPLTDVVPTLVTLGTPHAGTTLADEFTALFVVALPAAEQGYFQGAYDLGTASPFVGSLNGAYVDNPTAYFTVAGDLGLGTDGVVTVVSAVQTLPVYPGEDTLTVTGPLAAHTLLHGRALTLGIVDRLLLWLSP